MAYSSEEKVSPQVVVIHTGWKPDYIYNESTLWNVLCLYPTVNREILLDAMYSRDAKVELRAELQNGLWDQ